MSHNSCGSRLRAPPPGQICSDRVSTETPRSLKILGAFTKFTLCAVRHAQSGGTGGIAPTTPPPHLL